MQVSKLLLTPPGLSSVAVLPPPSFVCSATSEERSILLTFPGQKIIGFNTITKPTARENQLIINNNCIILSVVQPIRGIVMTVINSINIFYYKSITPVHCVLGLPAY